MTNALNQTTTFNYELADLVGVTTPLGHTETRFVDTAGRLLRVTDARGAQTRFEYDNLNQLTKITDPLAGETTFTYDGNGNLLTLTDARGKTTTWTYDDMDRIATRTDPLSRQESFTYDLNGNLKTWTDRKGQVTSYSYDALDRWTFIGFGTTGNPPTYTSTITVSYDAGNRPTSVVDSVAGTITRSFDLLDRLTSGTTPEGTISYTYDSAHRRATSTVTEQTAVSYRFAAGDANLQRYVFNNPTRYTDPTGEILVPLALCAAGAGGSALADWMSGRKFNLLRAGTWCFAGLGLSFAGPAIGNGLGYGVGGAAGGGLAATSRLGPPKDWPLPPGWRPDWEFRFPSNLGKRGSWPRWFDPLGREWHWHRQDRWHRIPHWNFNPHTHPTSQWKNVYRLTPVS